MLRIWSIENQLTPSVLAPPNHAIHTEAHAGILNLEKVVTTPIDSSNAIARSDGPNKVPL